MADETPARYAIHWRDVNGDDEGVVAGGPHTVADGWLVAVNQEYAGRVVYWLEKVVDGREATTGYEEEPQTEPMIPVMRKDRKSEEPAPLTVQDVVKAVESDPDLEKFIAQMAVEYMAKHDGIGG